MCTLENKVKSRRKLSGLLLAGLLLVSLLPAQVSAKDDNKTFSQAELDQMMAPIALYPDSLLSQILMAATYPDQVAEAVKWSKKNKDKYEGDAAVEAVQDHGWNPSVASLAAFPQVLEMMGDQPDWVKTLGDAFLAQPEEVMDTAQSLRKKAKEAGNLESTKEQKVIFDDSEPETTIIKIEPSDPDVIYVPAYNPTVVYGTWWWPSYTPYYYRPVGYGFSVGFASGIGFGIGIGVTNAIWGSPNWHRHDIDIDVNRYNNINVNNRLDTSKTSASYRQDVQNRNLGTSANNSGATLANQKQAATGKVNEQQGRDLERQQAADALKQKGIDPNAERNKLTGSSGAQVRDQVSSVQQSDAFKQINRSDYGASKPNAGGKAAGHNINRDLSGSSMSNYRDSAFSGVRDAGTSRMSDQRGSLSNHSFSGSRAGAGGRSFSGGSRAGGGRRR